VLLNDAVGHGKPQTGSLALAFARGRLGGEERVVDALNVFLWDSISGVGNLHADCLSVGTGDAQDAALGHGVFGVKEQVQKDLLQASGVALDRWQVLAQFVFDGDLAGFELDPRILVMPYEGPQIKREFYAPKYDTPVSSQSRIPDFRNLLHWAPDVTTDAQGKSQISFYTSDQTGHYRVIVQGMTKNGLVGSKTFSFEVTRRNL